jgi:hypothetical protein
MYNKVDKSVNILVCINKRVGCEARLGYSSNATFVQMRMQFYFSDCVFIAFLLLLQSLSQCSPHM